jgi:hypothetical protein
MRFSTRGKGPHGTTLILRLHNGGLVELVVRDAHCAVVRRKRVRVHGGLNRVRFAGRFRGHALPPGGYAISVVAIRHGVRKPVGTIAVEVVSPGKRLSKGGPVVTQCGSAYSAAPPIALFALEAPTAARFATVDTGPLAAAKDRGKKGVLGASLRPPRLFGEDKGAGLWLGLVLLVVCALTLAVVVAYVRHFFRGSSSV